MISKRLLPLSALLVTTAVQVIVDGRPALSQKTTRDCGNPSGSFFASTGGTVDDNLICGSQNNLLTSLTQSIAVGIQNTVTANNATAVGFLNQATNANATAVGQGNFAQGDDSTAMGSNNQATNTNATAVGFQNNTQGLDSTTMG